MRDKSVTAAALGLAVLLFGLCASVQWSAFSVVLPNVDALFPEQQMWASGELFTKWNCTTIANEAHRLNSEWSQNMAQAFAIPGMCGQQEHVWQAEIDDQFVDNFHRYANVNDGWIDEAYVSFVKGQSAVDLAAVMIESVHRFSTRPVLVFLIGRDSACPWDPHEYDQLIVVRIEDTDERLDFYFSKIRAALLSRVKTALIVEADTLVYSSDELFPIVHQYTHEHALMPVHPDACDPSAPADSINMFNVQYLNQTPMTPRSLSYMHAHLSWTHRNLVWLAQVYTQCLNHAGLDNFWRGSACANDEMALNVALWAQQATTQLCLFDPYAGHLDVLEQQKGFPEGEKMLHSRNKRIAAAFYYVHGCKDPVQARSLLERMERVKHLPKYHVHGKWYTTRDAMLKAERLDCVL